jgi:dihydropteroate synthase
MHAAWSADRVMTKQLRLDAKMRPIQRVRRSSPIELRRSRLGWSRPYVVGVVNATPDSFSDGGRLASVDAAVARGLELVADGADILDVGGESTRPGAKPVSADVELERVIPVIRGLAERSPVPISIDTTKAAVARAAVEAGAELINDISGGRFDPAIIEVADELGAGYVLGHAPGDDLEAVHAAAGAGCDYEEVAFDLAARVTRLPAGLRHRTIVDPGLGFGKRLEQNIVLLRRAGELAAGVGCPVMVGPSRKRFLGALTGKGVADRDGATVGAALGAVACGAQLVRVHEVSLVAPALAVFQAIAGDEREA